VPATSFSFGVDPAFAESVSEGALEAIDRQFGRAVRVFDRIDNIFDGTTIPVTYSSCGEANAFYRPRFRDITLCNEFLDVMFTQFTSNQQGGTDEAARRAFTYALEAMTFTLYHEAGHALDDIRSVGTGGNFESVADTIGTVLSVSTDQPLGPIFAGLFFSMSAPATGSSGIHGNGLDRAYDLICWATGSSSRLAALVPEISAQLVGSGRDCTAEYADGQAFVQNLIPDLRQLPPAASVRRGVRAPQALLSALEKRFMQTVRATRAQRQTSTGEASATTKR